MLRCALVLLLLLPATAGAAVQRVSVQSDGAQFTRASGSSLDVSADGNLVAFGITKADPPTVYVRDVTAGTTEKVGRGYGLSLSRSGRYVAFVNAQLDGVRIVDREARTERAVSASGKRAEVTQAVLSGSGRVLFYIADRAVGHGEGSDSTDAAIYRYDIKRRTTLRLTPLTYDITGLSASFSGRYVGFASTNYGKGSAPAPHGLFVMDTRTGKLDHIRNGGYDPQITGSGRWMTFSTGSTVSLFDRRHRRRYRVAKHAEGGRPALHGTKVAFTGHGKLPQYDDVYVWTRATGKTERLTANQDSSLPVIATDGAHVAFWSGSDELVEGDDNGVADIFLADS